MDFDISILLQHQDEILNGLLTTLRLAVLSGLCSIILGFWVAIGFKIAWPVLRALLQVYIQVFRNTPMLIQMYFLYKGLPHLGITLSPFMCAFWALVLQTGAYVAEIFRTGFEAVPQIEQTSGIALGLSRFQVFWLIVLPQTFGTIIPPLGNQMIALLKNTSLAAFITVPDIFFVIFHEGTLSFRYLEFFAIGVAFYMALVFMLSACFVLLEKRLCRPKGLIQEQYYAPA